MKWISVQIKRRQGIVLPCTDFPLPQVLAMALLLILMTYLLAWMARRLKEWPYLLPLVIEL